MINADDAVLSRVQNRSLARFTCPQGGVLLLDLVQHLIEGVGQQPQFVLTHLAGADRIILAVGHRFGRIGQGQDR